MVPTVKGIFQVSVIAVALLCWFYYEDYKIDRLKSDIVESLPAYLSELIGSHEPQCGHFGRKQ